MSKIKNNDSSTGDNIMPGSHLKQSRFTYNACESFD